MKLLRSTKKKINENKNHENIPPLEITEKELVHCNIANNDYWPDSRVLHTFLQNKSFGQLFNISPTNFIFLKNFNSEFSYTELWFTDQKSKPLDVEDKINITLVIN